MQIHDPIYICVSWVQHGIAQYLMNDYEDFKNHINQIGNLIKNNWKILSLAFQKALGWEPIEPDGSMYGMFKHNQPSDWDAVLLGLKKGVGVAPGKIFWPNSPKNTGYVRIHCGISSEKAKKNC
jgi:DNA-binding transcriptional MocR family regulator